MQHRFPLPAGYFAAIHVVPSEVQAYQSLARDIVCATQRELKHYVKDGHNLIDAPSLKLIKSKKRLHCYRKRQTLNAPPSLGIHGSTEGSVRRRGDHAQLRSSRHDDQSHVSMSIRSSDEGDPSRTKKQPEVMGYGMMDGTVDDVVYGLYQSTTTEMKAMSKFLGDDSLIDCAVLQTLCQTPSSYLGLKWKLSRTVGGNRDCCYLESVGVAVDGNGQRFGYHVLESVVVKSCPLFHDKSIARTNLSFCFLFEPGKLAGQVQVLMKGAYDSSADRVTAGGVGDLRNAMDLFFHLPTAMIGAEAKKITTMVDQQSKAKSKRSSGHHHCSLCRTKLGLLSSRPQCQTCGAIICSKCRVRNVTFTGFAKVKVSCCKKCMIRVKNQSPFARDTLEQHLEKPVTVGMPAVRQSHNTPTVRMDRMHDSVSTLSLTDSEYSSSWQSSSLSSLQSDLDDSMHSFKASAAMIPRDCKMPALLESEGSPQLLVTFQSEEQRRYELQQIEQQEFYMRQRIKPTGASKASRQRQLNTYEGLYNQMLELQVQAEQTYNLTNQNASKMYARR